jgi:hypothetical protein
MNELQMTTTTTMMTEPLNVLIRVTSFARVVVNYDDEDGCCYDAIIERHKYYAKEQTSFIQIRIDLMFSIDSRIVPNYENDAC